MIFLSICIFPLCFFLQIQKAIPLKLMVQAYEQVKPELEITKANSLKQLWELEKDRLRKVSG